METIAISKFKATCLATLDRVNKTGQPVRVTRFGKPVADIVPATPEPPVGDWLGSLAGTAEICGDIMIPSSELVHWDALNQTEWPESESESRRFSDSVDRAPPGTDFEGRLGSV